MSALSTIEFDLPNSAELPKGLQDYRQENKAGLSAIATPTRKTESWKYSAKRLGLLECYPAVSAPSSDYQPAYSLDCDTLSKYQNF